MTNPARERLRRLLLLVPYVVRHPGITVDALASHLGVERSTLLGELDLLTLVGRPPFQPDDYVDIYVENDRVWVHLDARLSAPPRFTVPEAVALAAAARTLGSGGGEVLRSALRRLEEALPPAARASFQELVARLDTDNGAAPELQPLTEALRLRREVTFDYLTPGREGSERRHVRPTRLEAALGHWYLTGFDVGRGGNRQFRLDRLSALTVTDIEFGGATEPEVPREVRREGPRARVWIAPRAAPFIRERFGAAVEEGPDDSVYIEIPAEPRDWAVRWVLGWAGDARVLSPPSLRAAVAHAAGDSLDCAAR